MIAVVGRNCPIKYRNNVEDRSIEEEANNGSESESNDVE
jgi:hypothetical protein